MSSIEKQVSCAVEATAEAVPALTAEDVQANLNIVWTCVAAFLVFFMQAGECVLVSVLLVCCSFAAVTVFGCSFVR